MWDKWSGNGCHINQVESIQLAFRVFANIRTWKELQYTYLSSLCIQTIVHMCPP